VLCVLGTAIISLLIPQFVRYHGAAGLQQKALEEAMREAEARALMVD
jgi:hypothetical protein